MSCQHKLFSIISALTEKLFCLTGNPIKTLLAILFLIVARKGRGGSYLIIIRECSRSEFVH